MRCQAPINKSDTDDCKPATCHLTRDGNNWPKNMSDACSETVCLCLIFKSARFGNVLVRTRADISSHCRACFMLRSQISFNSHPSYFHPQVDGKHVLGLLESLHYLVLSTCVARCHNTILPCSFSGPTSIITGIRKERLRTMERPMTRNMKAPN